IQTCKTGAEDPYVDELISEIDAYFDASVPVFSILLKDHGRAASWYTMDKHVKHSQQTLSPCKVATWPVVSYNGDISACCNQIVVDGPIPKHLKLGNIFKNTWQEVRTKTLSDSLLRGVRTYGPIQSARKMKLICTDSQCETCRNFAKENEQILKNRAEELMNSKQSEILEDVVQDSVNTFSAISLSAEDADLLTHGLT
ncbi:MAG: SPASM domain-containing protein, partial [Candidatus Peribacteraceae bacterium]|nr:SPASM domain-containing protein [Candidatus Peribacteraceae bacterium]